MSTLLPTVVADTLVKARDRIRLGLAAYAGFFPRYNQLVAEHGFGGEAAAIVAAWKSGEQRAAIAAVSDDMIEATSIATT